MMGVKQCITWVSGLSLLFILVLVGWGANQWMRFTTEPILHGQAETTLWVPPGQSLRELANHLVERQYIRDANLFVWWVTLRGSGRALQAGEYRVTSVMTLSDLLHKMEQGEVIIHRFTVVEGWNVARLRQALREQSDLRAVTKTWSDQQLKSALSIEQTALEGWFYPSTYYYTRQDTDLDILSRAHQLMQTELAKVWRTRDKKVPYTTPYQALIVGSIIEKESHYLPERNEVSGVIMRRLKKGMPLQIDATVLYGLFLISGALTKKNLLTETPYNTYLIKGLPPTPISLPSGHALTAALHPDDGNSLYFVANGEGGHYFSRTHKQHIQAVKRYLSN